MPAEAQNYDMLLGEMRGQLRELVHSVNNLNGKVDGLTREVVALGPLGKEIAAIEIRVAQLEEKSNNRQGAAETMKAILGSPFVMWLVMIAGFVWAAVTGRIRV